MKREQIEINTSFIKLDSFLKFCGAAETGGHAKEMVQGSEVSVNGKICEMRGKKLVNGDIVTVKGLDMEFEVVRGES